MLPFINSWSRSPCHKEKDLKQKLEVFYYHGQDARATLLFGWGWGLRIVVDLDVAIVSSLHDSCN